MADGLDSAIDTLKDILNSPDAAQTISSMLGSFGLGDATSEKQENTELPFKPELVLKIMDAYNTIGKDGDNRVALLRAVRPFMRETRRENVDTAIKLLTLLRLMPLLDEFRSLL